MPCTGHAVLSWLGIRCRPDKMLPWHKPARQQSHAMQLQQQQLQPFPLPAMDSLRMHNDSGHSHTWAYALQEHQRSGLRCYTCGGWGHISASCSSALNSARCGGAHCTTRSNSKHTVRLKPWISDIFQLGHCRPPNPPDTWPRSIWGQRMDAAAAQLSGACQHRIRRRGMASLNYG
eukprot:COSAG01_NODE_461_length_16698_cov_113.458160_4_plen_176_part_00